MQGGINLRRVTIPQGSRLYGCSSVAAWKRARAGRWGQLFHEPGKPAEVEIIAIEHDCGRTFSDGQIRAARRPVKKRRPSKVRVDPAAVEIAIILRDQQWWAWLSDETVRQVQPAGPDRKKFLAQLLGDRRIP